MKVLGVKIDQKLSWEHHIASIKKKTCNAIRNIARTSEVLPIKYRILLHEALVTPHYNYCDVIYDGCSEKAKADLQRNQNYAARALLGRSKYSSGSEALKQLKWLPLESRRKLHTGVFIHKAVNGKSSQHAVQMVEGLRPLTLIHLNFRSAMLLVRLFRTLRPFKHRRGKIPPRPAACKQHTMDSLDQWSGVLHTKNL